jgi:hypothetical protein
MKKISHFDRKVKQGKNDDCTCPYSPYGHVAGRTIMLTWQRKVWHIVIGWWLFNHVMTRVVLEANEKRARGPMVGRHVSLIWLAYIWFVKVMEAAGFDPRTSHNTKT